MKFIANLVVVASLFAGQFSAPYATPAAEADVVESAHVTELLKLRRASIGAGCESCALHESHAEACPGHTGQYSKGKKNGKSYPNPFFAFHVYLHL